MVAYLEEKKEGHDKGLFRRIWPKVNTTTTFPLWLILPSSWKGSRLPTMTWNEYFRIYFNLLTWWYRLELLILHCEPANSKRDVQGPISPEQKSLRSRADFRNNRIPLCLVELARRKKSGKKLLLSETPTKRSWHKRREGLRKIELAIPNEKDEKRGKRGRKNRDKRVWS